MSIIINTSDSKYSLIYNFSSDNSYQYLISGIIYGIGNDVQ